MFVLVIIIYLNPMEFKEHNLVFQSIVECAEAQVKASNHPNIKITNFCEREA